MERGCTGYYRLLLVRSLLATSLVSPPACAHARSLLSPAVWRFFVFKSPSCQHLITLRLYLPTLPSPVLEHACKQWLLICHYCKML